MYINDDAELNFKAVDFILKNLKIRYGAAFEHKFKDIKHEDLRKDWAYALKGLSSEQLRAGYDDLVNEEHVPNASKFHKMCIEIKDLDKKPLDLSHQFIKLDEPHTDSELARKNIEKIKSLLKIKTIH